MTTARTTLAVATLLAATVPQAFAAPVTGAIFTTLSDGSRVNANHYDSKCAVHLDGGPGPNAPAGAAGLPDGKYYFQVTDPSGRVLLSTDPVQNRQFVVSRGVITQYIGVGGPAHPTGTDRDHPELGAITIRLANTTCPEDFLDSPNGGGTYKVWATPIGDFVGEVTKVDNDCGNGCFHGFVPSKSKTDNFKAKTGTATFCLDVEKQFLNSDSGVYEPTEGWPIYLTDTLNVTNTHHTGPNGHAVICGLTAGAYTVAEENAFSIVTGLFVNGAEMLPTQPIYSFVWSAGKPAPVILFRNAMDAPPN